MKNLSEIPLSVLVAVHAVLDETIPRAEVRGPTDLKDPLTTMFEAGKRSIVDMFADHIANLKAKEAERNG